MIAKKIMNILKRIAHRARDFMTEALVKIINAENQELTRLFKQSAIVQQNNSAAQAVQLQLKLTYQSLVYSNNVLPGLESVGFKAYSQTDEDGILLYIFSLIGSGKKTCVEICAGNGIECNTANLIINHGWHGLLIDGDQALVDQGREFYENNKNTFIYPPVFISSWITRENINDCLKNNGFEGEIDLLSIDMDGVDYWIWDAIKAIEPRVVVVEYQDIIGPDQSLTVPYHDDFNAYNYPVTDGMPNYCGASLPAFVKLAKKRGYRLVGCNRYGYNAFFVKNTHGQALIPEIDISECFKHPKVLWGMSERFKTVSDLPWVEV